MQCRFVRHVDKHVQTAIDFTVRHDPGFPIVETCIDDLDHIVPIEPFDKRKSHAVLRKIALGLTVVPVKQHLPHRKLLRLVSSNHSFSPFPQRDRPEAPRA